MAPLVPDPSSLEQIVISPEAAAIAVVPIVATPNNAAIATKGVDLKNAYTDKIDINPLV